MQTFRLILSFGFLVIGSLVCTGETLSLDAIRSRIRSISETSASSTSGNFSVSGTNRLENLVLIRWCEDARDRLGAVTGLPVPFKERSVRFIVRDDCTDAPGGVAVRHGRQGKSLVHRIYLCNYDLAYGRRGRQALCHAILAGYMGSSLVSILELPPWLWKGLEQNVLFGVRAANMELAMERWRNGKLSSVWDIVGTGAEDARNDAIESEERLVDYGAFVHWLSSLLDRKIRFQSLFNQMAAGQPVTVSTLGNLIPTVNEDTDIDEAWDRWLTHQEHVVFLPGTVSTRIMDQLRAELFLHPGSGGIPLDAALPRAATLADLVPQRHADWIEVAVRGKRSRLELLAVGRAEMFRKLTSQFDEFLSSLESDVPDALLLEQLTAAYAAMGILVDQVEASGGLLRDEGPNTLNEKQDRSTEP